MIRVLVVDDHPVLRAGLEAVLRAEPGFSCVGTAADGHELAALVRRTRPDVVLLDLRLGDDDGLALCGAVRGVPTPPAVVIYTANVEPGLEADAAAAGASGVIEKTDAVGALFDAVRLAARDSRTPARR